MESLIYLHHIGILIISLKTHSKRIIFERVTVAYLHHDLRAAISRNNGDLFQDDMLTVGNVQVARLDKSISDLSQ